MVTLEIKQDFANGNFMAMASPCQLLLDTTDMEIAAKLVNVVAEEAWRIERKYSRYDTSSVLSNINKHAGAPTAVDSETEKLLNFATTLFELSEGYFDISSGVLRQAWHFDGSDNIPTQQEITPLLKNIGWQKVSWHAPSLSMPLGMEIDFGGIGKEYAVDRAFALVEALFKGAFLINFGGDLRAKGPRIDGSSWQVGIEALNTTVTTHAPAKILSLATGAIATSGDSRRFLFKNGIRYSHILNPKTGWPIENAARSITVKASTCIEAGMLSTLAMLHGVAAQDFLSKQSGCESWLQF